MYAGHGISQTTGYISTTDIPPTVATFIHDMYDSLNEY